MIREEIFKPSTGPIGALGISSETSADFGKDRRTTTKAPPGEMLMAVANSKESLPLPSRVRIKTGIASCNRAHLRSSFPDKLRRTCLVHHIKVLPAQRPHLRGQTRRGIEPAWNRPKPRHRHGDDRSNVPAVESHSDYKSYNKSATFFAPVSLLGCFQLTVCCT